MANTKSTIILGLESSCDETAAAIIRAKKMTGEVQPADIEVLANVVSSQIDIHAKYGGVVPEVAARKHVEAIIPVLQEALLTITAKRDPVRGTNYSLQTIDAIVVTHGPGLITSLRLGVETAKTLSYIYRKPLVPVNHIEGHIYSNWLRPIRAQKYAEIDAEERRIYFPALVLVVSGGHTELILMKGHGKYEIIGQTRDDAVGEAFDKVAKILGLPYPGGPAVSATAEKFEIRNPKSEIRLPRPMIDSPDFDFSFAGLKTAVLYLVRDLEKKGVNIKELTPQIAYEFQSAAVEVLVAKTRRAAEKYNAKTVLLAGGVSANKKLRKDLGESVGVMPGVCYVQPSLEYSTDNAAMIAAAGYFNYIRNPKKFKEMWKKVDVDPNLSL